MSVGGFLVLMGLVAIPIWGALVSVSARKGNRRPVTLALVLVVVGVPVVGGIAGLAWAMAGGMRGVPGGGGGLAGSDAWALVYGPAIVLGLAVFVPPALGATRPATPDSSWARAAPSPSHLVPSLSRAVITWIAAWLGLFVLTVVGLSAYRGFT